ncbi:UNVERIFIED_CONTAM: hypothetical protein FKN15_044450 [Acipenser sinensis]
MKKGREVRRPAPLACNFATVERVAGAPRRGAAGHEEGGGGGLETTPKVSLAGGAGMCVVHRDATAVWVGGGNPAVASTFGLLLPLFLGRDC